MGAAVGRSRSQTKKIEEPSYWDMVNKHMDGSKTVTDEREPDSQIQALTDLMKGVIQAKAAKKYEIFKAIKYRGVLDEKGITYELKVQVGENDYIHSTIENKDPALGLSPKLRYVAQEKTLDDPIHDLSGQNRY